MGFMKDADAMAFVVNHEAYVQWRLFESGIGNYDVTALFNALPDPLPVPIVSCERGPWSITTFDITREQATYQALKNMALGRSMYFIKPGHYTRLMHKDRGVVMSNTPMEVWTNSEFIAKAKGLVLINGLGLGMALLAVLKKPEVSHVTVYEMDTDVIDMVAPAFAEFVAAGKLDIRQADCLRYLPSEDEMYDIAWHDIWDNVSDDNLADMALLKAKWAFRVGEQLCWVEEQCQIMKQTMELIARKGDPQEVLRLYIQSQTIDWGVS